MMPITVKPKKSAVLIKRGRNGRDLGPNPFLDPKMEGNLEQSYKAFKAGNTADATYEATVPGKREKYTYTRGKSKGQQGERITGDADTVVRLLRDAADQLSLGVTIQVLDAKQPGHMTVVYMAKNRKAPRKPKATA